MDQCALGTALVGFIVSAAWASPVGAQVTAVLTADNHYGIFHGRADGDEWAFIGRNELGSQGDPGDYNWSLPEKFGFDAPPDHHIYVVAWDEDGAGLSMFVGEFTLPDGRRVVTDVTGWECLCGSGPSPRSGEVPTDDILATDIAVGTFGPPLWSVPNGSEPWAGIVGGIISDIGPDAYFIWSEDSLSESACGDHYVIFRTVDPVGPGSRGFIRGDSNADGAVNLSDAVYTLRSLFLGGPQPSCLDAADADDNGVVSLTDAVYTLNYLFLAGKPPPAPGPEACGVDPMEDTLPACSYDQTKCGGQ